jgi:hypothetical protein
MPSITYAGVKYDQVRHAIYCKSCKTTVESKSTHDFKMCSCNSVGVDGGINPGNRIIGSPLIWEPRMMYIATVNNKKLWLPESEILIHCTHNKLFSKTLLGSEV